jgi:hypothetical protein
VQFADETSSIEFPATRPLNHSVSGLNTCWEIRDSVVWAKKLNLFQLEIAICDNPIFPAMPEHESTQINTAEGVDGEVGGRTSLSHLIIFALIPSAGSQRGGNPTHLLHYRLLFHEITISLR